MENGFNPDPLKQAQKKNKESSPKKQHTLYFSITVKLTQSLRKSIQGLY